MDYSFIYVKILIIKEINNILLVFVSCVFIPVFASSESRLCHVLPLLCHPAEAIQNGEIVRLGELCTLQVSLSGKGAMTEEEYTTSLIEHTKINFRPGKVLANALSSLNYTKVAIKYPKEETEGEDEEVEEGA